MPISQSEQVERERRVGLKALLLGGAAAVAMGGPAAAVGMPTQGAADLSTVGAGSVTIIPSAGPNSAGYTTVAVPGGVTSTINLTAAPRAIIDWTTFTVANGNTLNFSLVDDASRVINRVAAGTISVDAGGVVNGQVGGLTGGNVWFLAPGGVLLNGTINASGVVASNNVGLADATLLNPATLPSALLSGSSSLIALSGVTVAQGVTIDGAGNIILTADTSTDSVSLASSGFIDQTGGALTATTLDASAQTGLTLTGPNQVGAISGLANAVSGDLEYVSNRGAGVAFTGPVTNAGGMATLTASAGDLSASGAVAASDDLTISAAAGDVTTTAGLTSNAGDIDVSALAAGAVADVASAAAAGDVTVQGATAKLRDVTLSGAGPHALTVSATEGDAVLGTDGTGVATNSLTLAGGALATDVTATVTATGAAGGAYVNLTSSAGVAFDTVSAFGGPAFAQLQANDLSVTTLSAGGAATARSASSVLVADAAAGGDITVLGGVDAKLRNVTLNGVGPHAVSVTAGAGDAVLGADGAGPAANTFTLAGGAADANTTLQVNTVAGSGDASVNLAALPVTLDALDSFGGDVFAQVQASGLTIGTATAGGAAAFDAAAGSTVVGSAAATGDVTVLGGVDAKLRNVTLNGAGPHVVQVTAGTGDAVLGADGAGPAANAFTLAGGAADANTVLQVTTTAGTGDARVNLAALPVTLDALDSFGGDAFARAQAGDLAVAAAAAGGAAAFDAAAGSTVVASAAAGGDLAVQGSVDAKLRSVALTGAGPHAVTVTAGTGDAVLGADGFGPSANTFTLAGGASDANTTLAVTAAGAGVAGVNLASLPVTLDTLGSSGGDAFAQVQTGGLTVGTATAGAAAVFNAAAGSAVVGSASAFSNIAVQGAADAKLRNVTLGGVAPHLVTVTAGTGDAVLGADGTGAAANTFVLGGGATDANTVVAVTATAGDARVNLASSPAAIDILTSTSGDAFAQVQAGDLTLGAVQGDQVSLNAASTAAGEGLLTVAANPVLIGAGSYSVRAQAFAGQALAPDFSGATVGDLSITDTKGGLDLTGQSLTADGALQVVAEEGDLAVDALTAGAGVVARATLGSTVVGAATAGGNVTVQGAVDAKLRDVTLNGAGPHAVAVAAGTGDAVLGADGFGPAANAFTLAGGAADANTTLAVSTTAGTGDASVNLAALPVTLDTLASFGGDAFAQVQAGGLAATAITAGGSATAQAAAGPVVVGSAAAGANIAVAGGTDAKLRNVTLNGAGPHAVAVTAGTGDAVLGADGTGPSANTFTLAGGAADANTTLAVSTTAGTGDASVNLAALPVTLDTLASFGGDAFARAQAGGLAVGAASAAGSATVLAAAGSATAGSATAGGNVTVQGAADAKLRNVTLNGAGPHAVTVTAGTGDAVLGADGFGPAVNAFALAGGAADANTTLAVTTTAGTGDASVNLAALPVTLDTLASFGGDAFAQVQAGDLAATTATAGSSATFLSAAGSTVVGSATARGNITVQGAMDAKLRDVSLNGAGPHAVTVTAGTGDAVLGADGTGPSANTFTLAGGAADANTTLAVTTTAGAGDAGVNLAALPVTVDTLASSGGDAFAQVQTVGLTVATANAASVTVRAGGLARLDTGTAAGDILVSGGSAQAGAATAGGNVTVQGAADAKLRNVSLNGAGPHAVTVTAGTGDAVLGADGTGAAANSFTLAGGAADANTTLVVTTTAGTGDASVNLAALPVTLDTLGSFGGDAFAQVQAGDLAIASATAPGSVSANAAAGSALVVNASGGSVSVLASSLASLATGTAGGGILVSGGSAALDSGTAGGGVTVLGSTGSASVNTLAGAGGNVTVTGATGAVLRNVALTGAGPHAVAVTAGTGDAVLGADGTGVAANSFTLAGGASDANTTLAVRTTAGTGDAGVNLASLPVTVDTLGSFGGDAFAQVQAGDLVATTATAGASAAFLSAAGSTVVGSATAGGNVTVQGATDAKLRNVTLNGAGPHAVAVTAGTGDAVLGADGTGAAANSFTLAGGAADANTTLVVTTTAGAGDASVNLASLPVTLDTLGSFGGDAFAQVQAGDLTATTATAGGSATLNAAAGSAFVTAATAGGSVNALASSLASLTTGTAGGGLLVSGGSAQLGSGTAGAGVTVLGSTGSAAVNTLASAGGNVTVTGATAAVLRNVALTGAGPHAVTVTAGTGDAVLGADGTGAAANSFTLAGGASDANTTLAVRTTAGTGDAGVNLASLPVTLDTLGSFGGDAFAQVQAGDLTIAGATAPGSVSANAAAGSALVANASGGSVGVQASGLAILQTGTAGGGIVVSGGSSQLGSGTAGGSVTVQGSTGAATVGGQATAGADVTVDGATGAILRNVTLNGVGPHAVTVTAATGDAVLGADGTGAAANAFTLAGGASDANTTLAVTTTAGTGDARVNLAALGVTLDTLGSFGGDAFAQVQAGDLTIATATAGGAVSAVAAAGSALVTTASGGAANVQASVLASLQAGVVGGDILVSGGSAALDSGTAGGSVTVLGSTGAATVAVQATAGADITVDGATGAILRNATLNGVGPHAVTVTTATGDAVLGADGTGAAANTFTLAGGASDANTTLAVTTTAGTGDASANLASLGVTLDTLSAFGGDAFAQTQAGDLSIGGVHGDSVVLNAQSLAAGEGQLTVAASPTFTGGGTYAVKAQGFGGRALDPDFTGAAVGDFLIEDTRGGLDLTAPAHDLSAKADTGSLLIVADEGDLKTAGLSAGVNVTARALAGSADVGAANIVATTQPGGSITVEGALDAKLRNVALSGTGPHVVAVTARTGSAGSGDAVLGADGTGAAANTFVLGAGADDANTTVTVTTADGDVNVNLASDDGLTLDALSATGGDVFARLETGELRITAATATAAAAPGARGSVTAQATTGAATVQTIAADGDITVQAGTDARLRDATLNGVGPHAVTVAAGAGGGDAVLGADGVDAAPNALVLAGGASDANTTATVTAANGDVNVNLASNGGVVFDALGAGGGDVFARLDAGDLVVASATATAPAAGPATGTVTVSATAGAAEIGGATVDGGVTVRAATDARLRNATLNGAGPHVVTVAAGAGDAVLGADGVNAAPNTLGAMGGATDANTTVAVTAASGDVNVNLALAGGLTLDALSATGGDVFARLETGDLAIGDAAATAAPGLARGTVTATATTGSAVVATVAANGDIAVGGGADAKLRYATVSGAGPHAVTVTAGTGDAVLGADGASQAANLFAMTGGASDSNTTVSVTTTGGAGDVNVNLAANGGVTLDTLRSAGGDVFARLQSGDLKLGTTTAAADVAIQAATGLAALGGASAGDDVAIRAATSVMVGAGGLTSGAGPDVAGVADNLIAAVGPMTVAGHAFDLAGGDIDVAGATVGVVGPTRAKGFPAPETAAGQSDARFQASGALDVASVDAERDILLDGAVGGAALVQGRALRAGRDIGVRSGQGAVQIASARAGDDIVVRARDDISAGDLTATGAQASAANATPGQAGDLLFAVDKSTLNGDLDLNGSNIDLRGSGAIILGGPASAATDARLQTARGETAAALRAITAQNVTAGQDVLADGGAVTAGALTASGRDVAVRARSGLVNVGSASAGDDIVLRGATTVTVRGPMTAAGGANAAGAADRMVAVAESGPISALLDPTAASAASPFALAAGDVDVVSGAAVSLQGQTTGSNIRLQAATSLETRGLAAAQSIFSRGQTLVAGTDPWTAQSIQLEATAAGGLLLGDLSAEQRALVNLQGQTPAEISNASFQRLQAPSVSLYAGDTRSATARGGSLTTGALKVNEVVDKISTLNLFAGSGVKVEVADVLAPARGQVTFRIGAPSTTNGANWTPGSIFVLNDGQRLAGAIGSRDAPFRTTGLYAVNDIIFGTPAFRETILASPPEKVDGLMRTFPTPLLRNGAPVIFLASGSLSVGANDKIVQQNSSGFGVNYAGIVLTGAGVSATNPPSLTVGAGTVLAFGRTDGGASGSTLQGTPNAVELFFSLTDPATGVVFDNTNAAVSPRIGLFQGTLPSQFYRVNSCVVGQQGNCTPTGNPIINIQPSDLTLGALLRQADEPEVEDITITGAANEEIWRRPEE